MTFEMLAKKVADEFREIMTEEGCESFAELKKSQMWSWADVKNEVGDILWDYADELLMRGHVPCFLCDEFNTVVLGNQDMSWGNFKKLLLAELN